MAFLTLVSALALYAALVLFSGCSPQLQSQSTIEDPQPLSAEAHLQFLAADELNGRFTGTPGIEAAEEYLAERFRAAGMADPEGFTDYRQNFSLNGRPWDFSSLIEIGATAATLGADFAPLFFSGEAELEAPLIFVGYGIRAPEYGRDDYAGLDVRGKVVIALRHEPEEADADSVWNGTEFTEYATFLKKAETARALGAVGFATFTDPLHHAAERSFHIRHGLRLGAVNPGQAAEWEGFPAVILSRETAEAALAPLLREAEIGLDELQRREDQGRGVRSSALGRIAIDLYRGAEQVEARNVGGLFLAADERPTVIIGAHYDHLGGRSVSPDGSDAIFNGADDNASGTAVLLAVAERIAREKPNLSVNLLFVAFSAEELGLFGSRYFTDRDGAVDDVELMINLDMVGRNSDEPIRVFHQGVVDGMLDLLQSQARETGSVLRLEEDSGEEVSDHSPFSKAGVPTLFFFTGFHDQYHQLDDEADSIDWKRLEEVADLLYRYLIEAYGLKPSM